MKRVVWTPLFLLASIGFVDVYSRVCAWVSPYCKHCFSLPFEMSVERIVTSADGRFKAIVFTEEGTGLDPHCTTIVSVVPASWSAPAALASGNRVLETECIDRFSIAWNRQEKQQIGSAHAGLGNTLWIGADPRLAWSTSRISKDRGYSISFESGRN